jgi:hypothetical protein
MDLAKASLMFFIVFIGLGSGMITELRTLRWGSLHWRWRGLRLLRQRVQMLPVLAQLVVARLAVAAFSDTVLGLD